MADDTTTRLEQIINRALIASLVECPNGTCAHPSVVHDVYDMEDPYPACCTDGCLCGHPGIAIVVRAADMTSTVRRADLVIRVSDGLLRELGLGLDDVLVLDTAGRYRYRYLRLDHGDSTGHTLIYGRVRQDGTWLSQPPAVAPTPTGFLSTGRQSAFLVATGPNDDGGQSVWSSTLPREVLGDG